MNRTDLQRLSELRIKEARILLDAQSYPGAFYLAGYSVECALKACIAKRTKEHDFPNKSLANQAHVHDLEKLLSLADLKSHLDKDKKTNPALGRYWAYVTTWNKDSRYEDHRQKEAEELYLAISDPGNGVLPWLKKWW
jgi:HEPN domain-containing protein